MTDPLALEKSSERKNHGHQSCCDLFDKKAKKRIEHAVAYNRCGCYNKAGQNRYNYCL